MFHTLPEQLRLLYAALAFEQPDVADRVDRTVLAAYPGDQNERRNVVRLRMNQGLARRAAERRADAERRRAAVALRMPPTCHAASKEPLAAVPVFLFGLNELALL